MAKSKAVVRSKGVAENKDSWLLSNLNWILVLIAIVPLLSAVGAVITHFQFGKDIPLIGVRNWQTAQYWGQIGDFIGGLLNPLLSFVALLAVLANLVLQRKELALARVDAEEARNIQKEQSQIFEKQNFESVFFQLLDTHSRLSSSVRLKYKVGDEEVSYQGAEAFDALVKRYVPTHKISRGVFRGSDDELKQEIVACAAIFMEDQGEVNGHYFRNIYQILKYIDSYGQDSATLLRSGGPGIKVLRAMRSYHQQRTYANMLRAQLSSNEVAVLFLNCLYPSGEGLKFYVEKFSMLKTLPFYLFGGRAVKSLYSEVAFMESEEIDLRDIAKLSRERYGIVVSPQGDRSEPQQASQ